MQHHGLRLRPRYVNEILQGTILQKLLNGSWTTRDLSRELRENIDTVRKELISLHHAGAIEPIGYRMETTPAGAVLYQKDYLWALTDHALSHSSTVHGCTKCYFREKEILAGRFFP